MQHTFLFFSCSGLLPIDVTKVKDVSTINYFFLLKNMFYYLLKRLITKINFYLELAINFN
jgi:hypothetical protein